MKYRAQKGIHRGQVALVMVLIMTVLSALAVSLASRSTIDTRVQQTETESVQALIAAQTGLEQLIMSTDTNVSTDTYVANKTTSGSESLDIGRVESGGTVELSLADADFSTLTGFAVYWSPEKSDPSGTPSVFISVVRNNSGTVSLSDYAYAYTEENGFTLAQSGSEEGYDKRSGDVSSDTIAVNSSVVGIRITVYGSPALVKVFPRGSDGAEFPPQLKSIRSVGSIESGDKTVKYGLQYEESENDTVPGIFDYVLFSGGSLIQ
ncbi:MAG TPA: hypothetical protein PLI45_00710 [Candidatus Woesebacteria bacterium]|nr:hypothetical protein [Candidatus Woesebacteria bacterium]